MNSTRSYIREIWVQEAAVGISYYGQKGKDITAPASTGAGFNPVTAAGKALDSFFGISNILKSIPGASLITSLVPATFRSALAAPTLVGAGASAAIYGAYKLYQYETGDSNEPQDLATVQGKADKIRKFQSDVINIIDRRRQSILEKTRMASTQATIPADTNIDTLLKDYYENYENQAKKICDATDYGTFFTNVDQYQVVQSDIDTLITQYTTGSSSVENAKAVYTQWAYSLLVVDFVSNTFTYSADTDNGKITGFKNLTPAQESEITSKFNAIETKINNGSDYKNAKAAIMSLGGSR